jgi:predicted enzyme related to lactoylglutathione lyase
MPAPSGCQGPAMDVPTVGRMAVIRDPQGATLSIMQYAAS